MTDEFSDSLEAEEKLITSQADRRLEGVLWQTEEFWPAEQPDVLSSNVATGIANVLQGL